jgi:hypothetical protein
MPDLTANAEAVRSRYAISRKSRQLSMAILVGLEGGRTAPAARCWSVFGGDYFIAS